MRFSLTTWNINSVRLRIDIVAKFLARDRRQGDRQQDKHRKREGA